MVRSSYLPCLIRSGCGVETMMGAVRSGDEGGSGGGEDGGEASFLWDAF